MDWLSRDTRSTSAPEGQGASSPHCYLQRGLRPQGSRIAATRGFTSGCYSHAHAQTRVRARTRAGACCLDVGDDPLQRAPSVPGARVESVPVFSDLNLPTAPQLSITTGALQTRKLRFRKVTRFGPGQQRVSGWAGV